MLVSNELTYDSHKTTLMEPVGSRMITSCLCRTPWREVGIFLTPDTWDTWALTVTSCSAAT